MSPLSRLGLSLVLVSGLLCPSLLLAAPSKPAAPKSGPPAAVSAAAAEEEEGKIPGVAIPRANGTWLGLRVENNVFVLSFYTAKKKPAAADAARASARWNPPQKTGSAFAILTPSGTGSLTGNKPVTPPRIFKVYLTLLAEDGTVLESFAVDYRDQA